MSVQQFSVPGHTTRRDFAIYVVVAHQNGANDFLLYVGKTGDNRDGCNPVISRAGNHFSYNDIHSQLRNKIANAHTFDFEYFYVTVCPYDSQARIENLDLVNEMERAANRLLQNRLLPGHVGRLLNAFKGTGIRKTELQRRDALVNEERRHLIKILIDKVIDYIAIFDADYRSGQSES